MGVEHRLMRGRSGVEHHAVALAETLGLRDRARRVEKVDGELRNVEFVTFSNIRDPRVAAK